MEPGQRSRRNSLWNPKPRETLLVRLGILTIPFDLETSAQSLTGVIIFPALAKSESRSIIFENPHEIVTSNRQTVLAALHKAVNNVADAVTTTAARDFGALVHVVRHASKNDLLSIYGDAKAGAGFKNKQAAK